MLWLSDFAYLATWQGFVCVAFVIDAFARRIVGWRASRTAQAVSCSMPWNRRLLKQKNDIMPCWTRQPWPRNLNKTVSGKAGAVRFRRDDWQNAVDQHFLPTASIS
jgi:hypothetical protein